jgi:two-component system cell cycle sensor histidine kinase/response regulator CckA
LAERLRSSHPETKILFTSGYADDTLLHGATPGEDFRFIGKPFGMEELTRKVREVLDSSR